MLIVCILIKKLYRMKAEKRRRRPTNFNGNLTKKKTLRVINSFDSFVMLINMKE